MYFFLFPRKTRIFICTFKNKAVPLQSNYNANYANYVNNKNYVNYENNVQHKILFNPKSKIMKKFIFSFALLICALTAQAVPSITITPNNVDFGSVSIKGKTSVEGSTTFNVTYSGLLPYCGVVYEDVDAEMPATDAAFWIEGTKTSGWIYGGDEHSDAEGTGLTVHYYAEKAGTYTGKFKFYTYNTDADWTNDIPGTLYYMTVKVVVTSDAIVAKTIDFERINSTSGLKANDTVVFVSESAGAVGGPLYTTYLPAITENVTIDKTNGTAKIPETAQQFVVSTYGGNWQFTTADTKKRMNLDITGKGAFTEADPVAGQILAGWGVTISSGVATVSKPDGTFPVEFNSDRFKPYKTSSGTAIALYKKVGQAQELQSKLTITPATITFEDTEMEESRTVQITYTAENLTDDIVWAAEGTDASLFDVTDTGDRKSGTVTIKYKGNGTKTGAVSAKLSYLTQNAQLNPMSASFDINLKLIANTIKLTKLEFSGAPTQIEQGASIDMSQFVVFTPNDAADKSLTWTTDHDYQGTIDENGVLTAKKVTGNVVVTATSKKVPTVSASHTLTIVAPVITDFTLSDTEVTLNVGGTKTISVTAFVPSYASATASFQSSDTKIATVSNKGVIKAIALGNADITVTVGAVQKVCKVKVEKVAVNGISFTDSEKNLTLGSTLELNPTVDPAQAASEYTITWNSDNTAVATVSNEGLVSSKSVGDAVITATIDGKDASITIHVVAAATFAKVTDPATQLAAKDTIILALASAPVVAGARDGKKLTVLTSDITVTDTEAYADNACRLVLGTEKGQSGYTLTIVGGKTIAVNSDGNDILDANTKNCKFWEFVADGTNGYYVKNLGNTNAMFKYHSGNAAIKPYKAATTGAVYVYAYYRKYVAPTPTALDQVQAAPEAQKLLRNGQIIILRNGVEYSIDGKRLK